jgi:hypothetical protein
MGDCVRIDNGKKDAQHDSTELEHRKSLIGVFFEGLIQNT